VRTIIISVSTDARSLSVLISGLEQRWRNSHKYHMTIRVFSYIELYLGYALCFLDQFPMGRRHLLKLCYHIYTYIACTHARSVLLNALSKVTDEFTTGNHSVRYTIDREVFSGYKYLYSCEEL